jgi:hypothetical protein
MLELTGGRACGSGGYEKYGPKPVPQRLSGLVKDGVSDKRGLMPAVGALIQLAGCNQIGVIVATARAVEPIRPFAFDEIPQAIPLGAKSSFELPGIHGVIHGVPPLYK